MPCISYSWISKKKSVAGKRIESPATVAYSTPTDHFTTWELQNPPSNVPELPKIRGSPDREAVKVEDDRSGLLHAAAVQATKKSSFLIPNKYSGRERIANRRRYRENRNHAFGKSEKNKTGRRSLEILFLLLLLLFLPTLSLQEQVLFHSLAEKRRAILLPIPNYVRKKFSSFDLSSSSLVCSKEQRQHKTLREKIYVCQTSWLCVCCWVARTEGNYLKRGPYFSRRANGDSFRLLSCLESCTRRILEEKEEEEEEEEEEEKKKIYPRVVPATIETAKQQLIQLMDRSRELPSTQ